MLIENDKYDDQIKIEISGLNSKQIPPLESSPVISGQADEENEKPSRSVNSIFGESAYFLVSLGFHLLILAGLVLIVLPGKEIRPLIVEVPPAEEVEEIEEPQEFEISEVEQPMVGDLGEEKGSLQSVAQQVSFQALSPVDDYELPDDYGTIAVPDASNVLAAEEASASEIHLGDAANGTKGAAGAIDQVVEEIRNSCMERPTMVVWLFDQSASLEVQRSTIRKKFHRIYSELDQLFDFGNEDVEIDDAILLTQVYAFGNNLNRLMKKPSRNPEKILAAFDKISRDESGVERTFSSVVKSVKDHLRYRKPPSKKSKADQFRNLMVIIVSDEAGDDYGQMDNAIRLCRKWTVPVYVLGVPAPFGRQQTPVKWVDPDPQYDQTPQWSYVNQGPETILPERLNLGFFGQSKEEVEIIDSGFGPYALSRLAVETGGVYFSIHPNRRIGKQWRTAAYSSRMRHFFDSEVMRRYQPEYLSVKQYQNSLDKNRCRTALVNAAKISSVDALDPPALRFEKLNEARFVNSVTLAQRAAALLEPRLRATYRALVTGESSREKEIHPRWKAGYDLAMGRLLAAIVRTESYNVMLANAKTRLKFQDPKNNTWVLRASDSLEAGSRLKKMATKATSYLERVVQDHPDTPWALVAKKELRAPIGWRWEEQFTQPPAPPRPRTPNANNNPMPRNDQRRQIQTRPKRRPPKL